MVDIRPLGTGLIVLIVLFLVQPLSTSYSGISMNIIAALIVGVAAVTAAFQ